MQTQGLLVLLAWTVLASPLISGNSLTDVLHVTTGQLLPPLGKVLAVQGSDGNLELASAELYTPLLNTWGHAGSQHVTRTGFQNNPNNADHAQAVRMSSGKVLSFGGVNATAPVSLASAEAYDLLTDSWTSKASMLTPRSAFQAVLLHDGRVLAIGGAGPDNTFLTSTEAYSEVDNIWTAAASLNSARVAATAVLLHDGKVLVTGSDVDSSQEIYDPVNNSWAYAAPTSVARGGHQAVVLADGRVLIVGGRPSGHALASAELYNPSSNVTSATAPMKVARFQFQAVLLGDDKVLVMGGYGNDANESALSSCEIYDPASDTWTAAADMAAKRGAFKAVTLDDGSVMAVGGATAHFDAPALASAEIYAVSSNSWRTVAQMASTRVGLQAVVV